MATRGGTYPQSPSSNILESAMEVMAAASQNHPIISGCGLDGMVDSPDLEIIENPIIMAYEPSIGAPSMHLGSVGQVSYKRWNSVSQSAIVPENLNGGFNCNICLESCHEPVVTLYGHLYFRVADHVYINGSMFRAHRLSQMSNLDVLSARHPSLFPLWSPTIVEAGLHQSLKPRSGREPYIQSTTVQSAENFGRIMATRGGTYPQSPSSNILESAMEVMVAASQNHPIISGCGLDRMVDSPYLEKTENPGVIRESNFLLQYEENNNLDLVEGRPLAVQQI
ncbi:hypothetical protein SASPL_152506 [Salvia splendens]|uniref:Uncharacterized protein n=1 Tax=Salvia splendens TaxID=180675 RepID=A0A8X8W3Q4_SALSN|nr:hypothetical protein SASPL_152506 [Salvia splendens]